MYSSRLDPAERQHVERIRNARRIQIIIDTEDSSSYLELQFDSRRSDITDLRRNLRLAVQDFFQKSHKWGGVNI